MKALNECTAKAANKKAGRKGNSWDDRFSCTGLMDKAALLAAMVYVDLNPVRAGMARSLIDSEHTSAQLRLWRIQADRQALTDPLLPIAGPTIRPLLDMSQAAYLELADQTGRQLHRGKRERIQASVPPVLKQIRLNESQWWFKFAGSKAAIGAQSAPSTH